MLIYSICVQSKNIKRYISKTMQTYWLLANVVFVLHVGGDNSVLVQYIQLQYYCTIHD